MFILLVFFLKRYFLDWGDFLQALCMMNILYLVCSVDSSSGDVLDE